MVRASQKRVYPGRYSADAVVAEHRRTATVQGLWLVAVAVAGDRWWDAD